MILNKKNRIRLVHAENVYGLAKLWSSHLSKMHFDIKCVHVVAFILIHILLFFILDSGSISNT